MRELRTPGFVRGALSNERPYRDRSLMGIQINPSRNLTATGRIAIKNVGHAQMGKVAAMLGSLTLALAAVDDLFAETPYFPDVAEAAQEKLDRIIDSLDGINLERRRDGTSSVNGED